MVALDSFVETISIQTFFIILTISHLFLIFLLLCIFSIIQYFSISFRYTFPFLPTVLSLVSLITTPPSLSSPVFPHPPSLRLYNLVVIRLLFEQDRVPPGPLWSGPRGFPTSLGRPFRRFSFAIENQ